MNAMTSRRSTLATIGSLAAGLTVFTWVRWEEAAHWGGRSTPELVAPLAVSYLATAGLGLLLVKDRVRWWWVPGVLLAGLGFPVDYWIGSSVVSTRFGFGAGALLDLAVVLLPAGVAWLGARRRGYVTIHGRLIPTLFVSAIAVVLAMRVGIDGPDLSLPVGVALLAFGVLSQSSTWWRASAFVLMAFSLGAQIPSSFAISLGQGTIGSVAFVDALVDIAVGVLAFTIAPLSTVTRRMFERPVTGPAVHAPN
jgi:hypothetical protein